MADDEGPGRPSEDPSLELPDLRSALGFGRRRDRKATNRPDEPAHDETATMSHPAPVAATPEPVSRPEPVEPTAPAPPGVPVSDEGPGPETTPGPIGLPETRPDVETPALPPAVLAEPGPDSEPTPRRARRRPAVHLPGPLVALVTGGIVGLALVGLTSASLHLCSSTRGTSSCGKPGLLLLLVITVAMVFLGSLLLRLAGVDAHGSTSFLGVGLLVVVTLLALLPVIFHWWMVIVVPVVAMLTYAAAWWLTTTYVEPGERVR
jgi:hypothetical protein